MNTPWKFQEHWKQGRLLNRASKRSNFSPRFEFTSERPHYSLALFSSFICTCTTSKKDKFAFKKTLDYFPKKFPEYANNWLVSRIAVTAEAVTAETVNVTAQCVGLTKLILISLGLFVAIGLSSIFRYSHQTNYHCLCSFFNEIHVSNVLSSCKFQVKHSLLRRRVWLTKLVKIRSQTKRITSAYLLRHVTCSFREFSERIKISWITTATVKGKRKYKFFGVT